VFFSPSSAPHRKARAAHRQPTRARAEQSVEEAMQDGGEVLFLDGVGEVVVSIGRSGLSLQPLHPELVSSCWSSITLQPKLDNKIKFSDVYAVELLDKGLICGPWNTRTAIQGKKNIEMHRFVVHGITRTRKRPSPWVPCEYIFGHKDLKTCKNWFERLMACINNEGDRPKSLMVFVHPLCGKGRGVKNWEIVAPLFDRAKIKTKVNFISDFLFLMIS
jgi:ceramide kinase